jgi:NTE family protein
MTRLLSFFQFVVFVSFVDRFSNWASKLILFFLLFLQPPISFAQSSIIIMTQRDSSLTPHNSFYPFKFQKRPRVALVLSGGGARGTTQIGVLKVLERHHIPIDFIAATSMGAIVGGLYASGYTPAEIESLALNTNWDDVLSLTEDTKRTELFVDQKLQEDRSFLVVRFEGLEPVIPAAVSSGQRLTNFLSTQALQALYQPKPGFDDLKVRFRAVTTDLISGRRVILDQGSLAEALRASATVPLVFNPLKRDSMQLIDGGLISNIPVDLAKNEGYDIIIAVNATSGLRNADELKAPWQTADQIMGIMMQQPNQASLKEADIVITPQIGKHLSSDFGGLDTLIKKGEEAAELAIGQILALYHKEIHGFTGSASDSVKLHRPAVEFDGAVIPDSLWRVLRSRAESGMMTAHDVREHVRWIFEVGDFKDVYAEIDTADTSLLSSVHHSDSLSTRILYHLVPYSRVQEIALNGCKVIPADVLHGEVAHLVGLPLNSRTAQDAVERILRRYRQKGYSLANIKSEVFDESTGVLSIDINEGTIGRIDVQGGVRAKDSFVLREFPLHAGEVFEIAKADQGIKNISSTTLFEYVYLEVTYTQHDPVLTIRLKERASQLVRFGFRADDERNLQGSIDIRDENFQGLGTELGLNLNGGARNKEAMLEFKAHRLFTTYLTFKMNGFFSAFDSYFYGDAPQVEENHWDRVRLGEYRDERYGGRLAFGTQLEKFGNATVDYSLQEVKIKNKENAEMLREQYRLSMIRVGTTIDSKDSYPFPTAGFGMNISYEFALKGLGSQVGYNALRFMYESYTTWGARHTFHPKFTFGFADRTMPLGEQFRLGGRESMYGTREDDRRGRQLFLLNFEYRYHLPVRLLFDSYLRLRFDMGSISIIPEELKFATVRYGLGAELAFDTPVGPAVLAIGKGWFFGQDLPDNPIQQGPLLLYFMVGYQL